MESVSSSLTWVYVAQFRGCLLLPTQDYSILGMDFFYHFNLFDVKHRRLLDASTQHSVFGTASTILSLNSMRLPSTPT